MLLAKANCHISKRSGKMVNRVVLMGLVNDEPVFEDRSDGVLVARFRMTTFDQPIDDQGVVKTKAPFLEVDMHNIECAGPWAHVCGRNVIKGVYIIVEGKLRCRPVSIHEPTQYGVPYISVDNITLTRGIGNPNNSFHTTGRFQPVPTEA